MIVQCPSCKTSYRVADEVTKDTAPTFRCSRCRHTFDFAASQPAENLSGKTPSGEKLSPKPDEERELSFTFAAKNQAERQDLAILKDSATGRLRSDPDAREKSLTDIDGVIGTDEPFTFSEKLDQPKDGAIVHPGGGAQAQSSQTLPPPREATDNIFSLAPYRDQAVSTRPYLTLFALVVVFFAFVTAFYVAHPDASERIVKAIPVVGPFVLKNNHLKNGVALQSLHANYQPIQGNREVFVVTGVAQNQNPVIIREVRLSGQIYNLEGKEIEQQTIWIGNAISPRIIRGMTIQDISDLQRLKPLKSFEILPGDSIPFTIVFLKSTKGIKDFSCEVLVAQGGA